jgi:hypothetical protein
MYCSEWLYCEVAMIFASVNKGMKRTVGPYITGIEQHCVAKSNPVLWNIYDGRLTELNMAADIINGCWIRYLVY